MPRKPKSAPQERPNSQPLQTAPNLAQPLFISIAEAAHRLGVSTKTVRRAINEGRLVATPLGRRVLIAEAAFLAFVSRLMIDSVVPTPGTPSALPPYPRTATLGPSSPIV